MINFGTIGGTTVSGIVGVSPWLSPRGAYLKLRGESAPKPDNEAMARGRAFEPVVAQIYQANHPEYFVAKNRDREGEDSGYFEHCYDDERQFLTGSPDRLLFGADDTDDESKILAGLEIKTAQSINRSQWGERGTDQIPLVYQIQCHWYMGFYNVDRWEVAVMFFNTDNEPVGYSEYTIRRDDEVIQNLREAAITFWNEHVVPGIPPEEDRIDETVVEFIRNQYPAETAPEKEANEEEEKIIERYIRAKIALQAATNEYDATRLAVQEAIGENVGLSSRYGKVTWKKSKDRNVVDWKPVALKAGATQELVEQHTKTVEGPRVFNDRNLRIEEVC